MGFQIKKLILSYSSCRDDFFCDFCRSINLQINENCKVLKIDKQNIVSWKRHFIRKKRKCTMNFTDARYLSIILWTDILGCKFWVLYLGNISSTVL